MQHTLNAPPLAQEEHTTSCERHFWDDVGLFSPLAQATRSQVRYLREPCRSEDRLANAG